MLCTFKSCVLPPFFLLLFKEITHSCEVELSTHAYSPVSKVHLSFTQIGQPWTHAMAVDGWQMLLVDFIIECLIGVWSAWQLPLCPSCGNHFTAIMALLINHRKLYPWIQSCV